MTGDTVEFDSSSKKLKEQHQKYYDAKENGVYLHPEYRRQSDLLDKSDVKYLITLGTTNNSNKGETTTNDGKTVDINVSSDLKNDSDKLSTLSHEFRHGEQFEKGEIAFQKVGDKWTTINYEYNDEIDAFNA